MSSRQAIFKKQKSHVVTTSDFQKTNYLKTNLLKQIKKISTLGSIRFLFLFSRANLCTLGIRNKFFMLKIMPFKLKTTKKREPHRQCPSFCYLRITILHHSAHSRIAHRHCRFFLGLVNYEAFSCQEHAGN